MKRALQAILIAGEEMRDDTINGIKNITIREGHRDYTPGKVLLGCHILNWAVMREIISVRHTTIREVKKEEYFLDDFRSREDMLDGLRKYYPDLTMDSPVTVIQWK